VRDEPLLLREPALAVGPEHVVHVDVVAGDVLIGRDLGRRHPRGDIAGDPRLEHPRQPQLRPLPAAVGRGVLDPIVEPRERKVQEHGERDLALVHVVREVRARVVTGEQLIHRQHRPDVDLGRPAHGAAQLEEVAVDLLDRRLQPIEQRIERLWLRDELREAELGEVAIPCAPHRGDLLETARDPRLVLRAELREQLRLRRRDLVVLHRARRGTRSRRRRRGDRRVRGPRHRLDAVAVALPQIALDLVGLLRRDRRLLRGAAGDEQRDDDGA
jgi:hypothetical protein